eukprot:CAMPEP_0184654960 /NCGR_PEP_ID=MMETSP0308-20130426/12610_1 /TAXON_ID=38269 /ORGANISM="Gloeochaete witrockiana, Strain SAG 46.84" /LENGTH=82 /DNA_ID=CAMNT_0027091183 /DNA_START=251 /DNA_END=499 /DNA_ORIENTATION=-
MVVATGQQVSMSMTSLKTGSLGNVPAFHKPHVSMTPNPGMISNRATFISVIVRGCRTFVPSWALASTAPRAMLANGMEASPA